MKSLLIMDFGAEEMLKQLSHPCWFQAFGCILGYDWHSSGVTTTVCGAFKEGVKGLEKDLVLFVCRGQRQDFTANAIRNRKMEGDHLNRASATGACQPDVS